MSRMANSVEIRIRRLGPDVPLPSYAHPGDAGADLTTTVDVHLDPGERALVCGKRRVEDGEIPPLRFAQISVG